MTVAALLLVSPPQELILIGFYAVVPSKTDIGFSPPDFIGLLGGCCMFT